MPIRNPFRKTPGTGPGNDTGFDEMEHTGKGKVDSGFEPSATIGSNPSSALSIKGSREEPNEYKLCVVNDSGVYLPPSPPEEKTFWHRNTASTTPSSHRSVLRDTEPFSISRESFDSYRRSFDISARSPVLSPETPPRHSLDYRNARLPRSAIGDRKLDQPPPTAEEGFEDVGLNDESKPKKKGLFSRFGDAADHTSTSNHHTFHITGRKRGQSGQGAELGKIDRSVSAAGGVEVDN